MLLFVIMAMKNSFWLSSDCIGRTFTTVLPFKEYAATFPAEELTEFQHLGMTIGAFIVFPANKIDNKMTINGMRGFNRSLSDRMDLTLECIKRFYENDGKKNPLYECLRRYKDFFDLFENFKGYVDYFLLQDMVTEDYSDIVYWHPFDDFKTSATPRNIDEYRKYRERLIEFMVKRNQRIDKWQNERG